ncbi:MAG: hypothetical protein EU529_01095 [Promethearchaeota archaeon]|nr:MAG: hypothetical protein EU529_01095 [Candidatus Lokiarchaeota archaeon]
MERKGRIKLLSNGTAQQIADSASGKRYLIFAPSGPPARVSRVANPTLIAPRSSNHFVISSSNPASVSFPVVIVIIIHHF